MMADDKKPKAGKQDAKPAGQTTPETEATSRINVLQESIKAVEGEIRTLSGRFANRNPALVEPVKKENEELKKRMDLLQKALFGLLLESTKTKLMEDQKNQLDILKQAAIDYFKKANINPDLWKNIVF
jgi:hypothetical protein